MAQRKMIVEHERYWGEIEASLKSVIESLQAELDKYGESTRLERGRDYGCYECGGCDDGFYIVYEREETDAEMAKRLKAAEKADARRKAAKAKKAEKEAAAKAKLVENERKELARLLQKYGEE